VRNSELVFKLKTIKNKSYEKEI